MHRPLVLLVAPLALSLAVALAIAQAPPPPPPLNPLPPPPQPAGNRVTTPRANLGKVLFWDEQVSSTRTMACGTCHMAAAGGADARAVPGSAHSTNPGPDGVLFTADDIVASPASVLNEPDGSFQWSSVFGLSPQVTARTSMSVINSAYPPELFWDGRAGGVFADPVSGDTVLTAGGALENQALAPPASQVEMGHIGRTWSDVVARVEASTPLALTTSIPAALSNWINGRTYAQLFEEAFGTAGVTASRIAMAIASYERTLVSNQAPFDSLIVGATTLTPAENAGFQLFGRLPCAGCHGGALMSDNIYHYDGVRPASDDSGRAVVTHDPADLGAFKTPSLRNVALRSAFMHDGRFSTLAQVVDFYDRGGDFDAPNKSPAIHPLGLSPAQKAQLVAFLGRPLTDPRVAASADPFDRPSLYTESAWVPEVLADGVAGGGGIPQPVALEPALTGNPQFTIGLSGAPGGAQAVLVVDASLPPASGGIPASASFARDAITLQGIGGAAGWGSVTLAIPDDRSLRGATLYARWYVSDPTAPGGIAASPAVRIHVFGPFGTGTYTAVGSAPAHPAGVMHLYAASPNPFAAATGVRFDLYRAGPVHAAVYDVGGRSVRTLLNRASAPAGTYALAWDGLTDAGTSAPGGVYFCRLDAAGDAQTTRLVRTR